jgi:simple sugar transport system substrate-binding protein
MIRDKEKKMKRILIYLLILVFALGSLSLTACGSDVPAETTAAENPSSEKPAESSDSSDETDAPDNNSGELTASEPYKIATVVKLLGISWYDRLEQGLDKFSSDYGVESFMVGPEKADSALQVKIVEDLIAQKVDAICIVPLSAEAMEPVLKKARDAGIVVITHEASNMENIDFDIEAFDNQAYGEHLMQKLGDLTGGEGEYAQFVGTLTSTSHNEWVDAGEALQKELFPNMSLVTSRLEDNDDQKTAYDKARELLVKYPDLKAIQTSSMSGTAGVALAIDEMGLQDQVNLAGTCLVSVAGDYVESGAADMISFWDPADAGYAMNKLALLVLEGYKDDVVEGYDLGISGYESLSKNGSVLFGSAWIDVTKENMDDYDF